jgi:membrane protease YdiL (CAAX protease family)
MSNEILAPLLIVVAVIVFGAFVKKTIRFSAIWQVLGLAMKKIKKLFFSIPVWLRVVLLIFILALYALYKSNDSSSQSVFIPSIGP